MRFSRALTLVVAFLFAIIPSVFAQKNNMKTTVPGFDATFPYEIETVGIGLEGTKVLKVWAFDKTVDGAIEKAKKSAVAACIFKGLPASSNANATPPLCVSPGEEWNDYFFSFFSDTGKYASFVNITTDGSPSGQDRLKTKKGYKVGVFVQVLYDQLRRQLEDDGVINKMNTWF